MPHSRCQVLPPRTACSTNRFSPLAWKQPRQLVGAAARSPTATIEKSARADRNRSAPDLNSGDGCARPRAVCLGAGDGLQRASIELSGRKGRSQRGRTHCKQSEDPTSVSRAAVRWSRPGHRGRPPAQRQGESSRNLRRRERDRRGRSKGWYRGVVVR